MIRPSITFCKGKKHNPPNRPNPSNPHDIDIYDEAVRTFNHYGTRCPNCGASGKLSPHGSYGRDLVSIEDDHPAEHRIRPKRFMCASCKVTHALLPGVIVPYSPYSLAFKLIVMFAYFKRRTTVAAICRHHGIAVSTLYEWKGLFRGHKALLLGAVIDLGKPALEFLGWLLGDGHPSTRLSGFPGRFPFSFMQGRRDPATRYVPP
jgi:hypothetical protein